MFFKYVYLEIKVGWFLIGIIFISERLMKYIIEIYFIVNYFENRVIYFVE